MEETGEALWDDFTLIYDRKIAQKNLREKEEDKKVRNKERRGQKSIAK